jgi:hypothetical protein
VLGRRWRGACNDQIQRTVRGARDSVNAFAEVTAASGSLLRSWTDGRELLEFEHYPPDDVIDRVSGSQFYYHAHRDGGFEHGHLHLFWHATASGRRRYFRPGRRNWARTEPTHLLAVSLNASGLPVGLFTVNRWVTGGHWFDAATTLSFVERFAPGAVEGHAASCRWLSGFVRLYGPLIEQLLVQRDRRLSRHADAQRAFDDRRLEVLSHAAIDWAADLDALEAESLRRGGGPRVEEIQKEP